jgi:hypothetical protein
MTARAWLWPTLIAVSALAAAAAAFADLASPLRPWLVFWFLLVCPGMALVRLLQIDDGLAQLTLAIALSLALDAATGGVMLYAGAWSPNRALAILVLLSLAGAALQLVVAARSPRGRLRDT